MAIYMFVFSVILCITVTLYTDEPDYTEIEGLSFGTLTAQNRAQFKKSYSTIDIILSVVLVFIVIGILMYFTS
jgi:SSS family solute:Na+ symporter